MFSIFRHQAEHRSESLSSLESYEQNSKPVQIPKWEHQRIDWNEHVAKLLHENRFHHEYWMTLEAFKQLLELLRLSITVNVVKSNASSGLYSSNKHIYPELILAIGLRWLAGWNLIDICHVYGVSLMLSPTMGLGDLRLMYCADSVNWLK